MWIISFRSDPVFVEVNNINEELITAGRRINAARAQISSTDAGKKSLHDRRLTQQDSASQRLDAARAAESKELESVRAAFRSEKNAIDDRRKALNNQETSDLQSISNNLGLRLARLNSSVAELVRAEATELATTLAGQQNQSVTAYLRNYHIDDAGIPGIGPGFKTRLRMAGILSAADVDYKIRTIKGIGSARSGALAAWHQALKLRAQQKMPQALSPIEIGAIRGKFSAQRQNLEAQVVIIEQQVKDAEAAARTKYRSLREPMDVQESVAARTLQTKVETVGQKFKEQYESLGKVQKKLEDDFKRNDRELDEKCEKERKYLFTVHWEQEKIKRRLEPTRALRLRVT